MTEMEEKNIKLLKLLKDDPWQFVRENGKRLALNFLNTGAIYMYPKEEFLLNYKHELDLRKVIPLNQELSPKFIKEVQGISGIVNKSLMKRVNWLAWIKGMVRLNMGIEWREDIPIKLYISNFDYEEEYWMDTLEVVTLQKLRKSYREKRVLQVEVWKDDIMKIKSNGYLTVDKKRVIGRGVTELKYQYRL